MNAIILGDKYSKGMKSKGCSGLIPISRKKNILQNQCDILYSIFKNINITYIYGFDNKKFIDFYEKSNIDINVVYNPNFNQYNYAFSLSLVKELFNTDVIIVHGYRVLNKTMFKNFHTKNGSQIFIKQEKPDDKSGAGCIINNEVIENFSFDLDNVIDDVYYLDYDCANYFGSYLLNNKTYHNNFIFELLNKSIDSGHIIKSIGLK